LTSGLDQAVFEGVDETSSLPVGEGEPGLMVIAPLWLNNATPFLRWSSGDRLDLKSQLQQRAFLGLPGDAARAPHRRISSESVVSTSITRSSRTSCSAWSTSTI
jgi:phenylacetate-coenzyme A ligase PaaK-like adenylate-forming protein